MTTWRTERLQIEVLAPRHAKGLHAALDDLRVGTYIGGPDVTTVDALRARIERVTAGPPQERAADGEGWSNFAVALVDDGTIIGRLEATTYDGWAEVAYVFGPVWWGRGYATESMSWMLEHLRAAHGIVETWASVDPDNAPSIALLTRLGYTRVDPATRPVSHDDGDLLFTLVRPPDQATGSCSTDTT